MQGLDPNSIHGPQTLNCMTTVEILVGDEIEIISARILLKCGLRIWGLGFREEVTSFSSFPVLGRCKHWLYLPLRPRINSHLPPG